MMCNQKSSPVRRLRAVAIAPALLLAAVAVNNPSVASALGTASAVSLNESKVSENITAVQVPGTQVQAVSETVEEATQPNVLPEYPGGQMAMFKFMMDNLKYPEEAAKNGIQGRVAVRFVVSADGKLTDISVEKSVSPELDAEAMRVVGLMPAWTPAKKDGKPVNCSMVIPVSFKL